MCHTFHQGDHQLVITLTGLDEEIKGTGLHAYDAASEEQNWSVKEKNSANQINDICFAGVTTDGNGHLFVCDVNNTCVQIFSTDGTYMGPLIKKGQQGLGCPEWICWCEASSSLVVSHTDKNQSDSNVKISVIKLNCLNVSS